jgi:hypothetical protein
MDSVRHHLRITAIAWLCLQVVTLAVFIPQTCCLGHDKKATTQTASPEQCPLHAPRAPEPECRMAAACSAPMAALPMSIGVAGLTTPSFRFEPAITSSGVRLLTPQAVAADVLSPTPPPKA